MDRSWPWPRPASWMPPCSWKGTIRTSGACCTGGRSPAGVRQADAWMARALVAGSGALAGPGVRPPPGRLCRSGSPPMLPSSKCVFLSPGFEPPGVLRGRGVRGRRSGWGKGVPGLRGAAEVGCPAWGGVLFVGVSVQAVASRTAVAEAPGGGPERYGRGEVPGVRGPLGGWRRPPLGCGVLLAAVQGEGLEVPGGTVRRTVTVTAGRTHPGSSFGHHPFICGHSL